MSKQFSYQSQSQLMQKSMFFEPDDHYQNKYHPPLVKSDTKHNKKHVVVVI